MSSSSRMVRAPARRLNSRGSALALGERRSRLWQVSPVARVRSSRGPAGCAVRTAACRGARPLIVARERLLPLVRTLNAVSPLATLDRGYAIVSREGGAILRNAADASPGTPIEARLAAGRIRAKVEGPRDSRVPRFAALDCTCLGSLERAAALRESPARCLVRPAARECGTGRRQNHQARRHGASMPYVDADGNRALVVQDDSSWVAVVGIPLSAPLGPRQVIVRTAAGQTRDRIHDRRQALRQPVAQGGAEVRSICRRRIWSA